MENIIMNEKAINFLSKHPFLSCLTIITVAIAIGAAFANNVNYTELMTELIGIWVLAGIAYMLFG